MHPNIYKELYPHLSKSEIDEINQGLDEIMLKTLISKDNFPEPPEGHWHLMTLFSIALQIKARSILELGVRYGDWTQPLMLASILNRGKLTSVDREDTLNPNLDNPWAQNHYKYCPPIPILFSKSENIKQHFEFVQSDSIKFLEKCVEEKRKFDMFVVDDWHSYEHVKKEMELISQISDINTVILHHDLMGLAAHPNYHWTEDGPNGEWENGGPFRAIYELDINEWEWSTIPVNHGLTLLRKRSPAVTIDRKKRGY